jgi:putative hydrolase of the HAD superfamily
VTTTAGAPVVLWDFDGTLAWRPGLWSACIAAALEEQQPGHGLGVDEIRAAMRGRYPWNAPGEAHPHLCDPDRWWEEMCARIAQALAALGIGADRGAAVARDARRRFIDPGGGWRVFDDALPALQALADAGWRSAILSNHVPELEQIAAALGLAPHVERIFSSALTGFEKPHPLAFTHALRELGAPGRVWMVGDNPVADIQGASAARIPAILVRTAADCPLQAEGLTQAVQIILEAGVETAEHVA